MTAANGAALVAALLAPQYAYEVFGLAGALGGLVAMRRWLGQARSS